MIVKCAKPAHCDVPVPQIGLFGIPLPFYLKGTTLLYHQQNDRYESMNKRESLVFVFNRDRKSVV